jgi:hypothetical protein
LGLWGVFEEAAEEIGEGEIALKRMFQHLGLRGCGNGEGRLGKMTEWEMGVLDYSIKGCAWRRRLGFGWVLHIMCAIFCDQETQLHQADEFVFNRNIFRTFVLSCKPSPFNVPKLSFLTTFSKIGN